MASILRHKIVHRDVRPRALTDANVKAKGSNAEGLKKNMSIKLTNKMRSSLCYNGIQDGMPMYTACPF